MPIGRWVLHEATRHARRLEAAPASPLRINVNLSAKQLQYAGIVDDVERRWTRPASPASGSCSS